MAADQEGTLERLKALRSQVIDPKIAEHGGHIVKNTGDGLLVEFESAVAAARNAVEIQQAVGVRNAEAPEDRHHLIA